MADIEITQADINLVALIWSYAHDATPVDDAVQACAKQLAHHRLSAKLEAEREIVLWLRGLNEDDNSHNHWKHIALRIERGEHR